MDFCITFQAVYFLLAGYDSGLRLLPRRGHGVMAAFTPNEKGLGKRVRRTGDDEEFYDGHLYFSPFKFFLTVLHLAQPCQAQPDSISP